MGGPEKALMELGGQSLLGRVVDRLAPQAAPLALNANGDPGRFAAFGLPVIADSVPGRPGPLAGILAAMDWAAGIGAERVVTVASDTPFFPHDLVARLAGAAQDAAIVLAAAGHPERGPMRHPLFGLWPVDLRARLRADIAGGARRVGQWAGDAGCIIAHFPAESDDPFFNINTPDDLAVAQLRLR